MTTSTASPSGTARAAAATSRAWRLGSTCGRTRRRTPRKMRPARDRTYNASAAQTRLKAVNEASALKTSYKTFTFTFKAFDGDPSIRPRRACRWDGLNSVANGRVIPV